MKFYSAIFSFALLTLGATNFCLAAPASSPAALASIKDPAALISNEINRLDTLIQATQQSLDGQKKLRAHIVEYQKIQDLFITNPNDNDVLLRMVKSAYRTLEAIKENHLTQNFDPDFIDELTVLSQAASKRGVPKP